MTYACRCCGVPTGSDVCLTCRSVLPRFCLACHESLPHDHGDYVCADGAAELGPKLWAETQARRAYARTRPTCDDCGLPIRERQEPNCGFCHQEREERGAPRGGGLPPSIGAYACPT